MRFSENVLKRFKKNELIEIILELQEKVVKNIEDKMKDLYNMINSDRDKTIYFGAPQGGGFSFKYKLTPGDVIEVWSEEVTPSGYPVSGTRNLDRIIKLKNYPKVYEKIKKIGWNREAIELLKEI